MALPRTSVLAAACGLLVLITNAFADGELSSARWHDSATRQHFGTRGWWGFSNFGEGWRPGGNGLYRPSGWNGYDGMAYGHYYGGTIYRPDVYGYYVQPQRPESGGGVFSYASNPATGYVRPDLLASGRPQYDVRVWGTLQEISQQAEHMGRPAMVVVHLRDAEGHTQTIELADADFIRQTLPALGRGQSMAVWAQYGPAGPDSPLQAQRVVLNGDSFGMPTYQFDERIEGAIAYVRADEETQRRSWVEVSGPAGTTTAQLPLSPPDVHVGWRLSAARVHADLR